MDERAGREAAANAEVTDDRSGPSPLNPGRRRFDQLALVRRNGPLRNVAVSRLVSLLGSGMGPVGLAFACVEEPTIGVEGLGYAVAATLCGQLLFTVAGGVAADRFGPRRAVILGELLGAGVQAVTAALFLADAMRIATLSVLSFVFGLATALSQPSFSPLIRHVTSHDEELNGANALIRTVGVGARAIAAPLGGILVVVAGAPSVLLLDALSFCVSAALLRRVPVSTAKGRWGSLAGALREGWTALRLRPWLLSLAVGASVINAARAGGITVLGPQAIHEAGGRASAWGLLLGVQAAGSVTALWTIGQLKPKRLLVATMSSVLTVAGLLTGLALHLSLLVLAVLAFAAAGSISFFALKLDVVLQSSVPTGLLGRVVALTSVISLSLSPIGSAVSGDLAGAVGTTNALLGWAALVTVAVVAVLLVPSVRRFNDQPAPDGTAQSQDREAPQ